MLFYLSTYFVYGKGHKNIFIVNNLSRYIGWVISVISNQLVMLTARSKISCRVLESSPVDL